MKHDLMDKEATANPTPNMEQQRTMAEQKTTRPRSRGAKASKNESTTSGASGLAAATWRCWGWGILFGIS